MITDKETFFKAQSQIENIPFLQTLEWLESNVNESLNDVIYFVNDEKNPIIACWGVVTKHLLLGRKLLINGVCYNNCINSNILKDFFLSITNGAYFSIEVSDISQYNTTFEIGIRQAGYVRPPILSLCPMSLIVDLQAPFTFHRNWRRNVKKSVDSGNEFVVVDQPTKQDAENFVSLFSQLKERKHLQFSLSAEQVYSLLSECYKLFFIKDLSGTYIAGRIEYIQNNLIYDVYAANSQESINCGAVYQLQECILKYFSSQGYRFFDYGRIHPDVGAVNNVYVAKSYSGGYPISYNGQWLYTRYTIKYYMYALCLVVIRRFRNRK